MLVKKLYCTFEYSRDAPPVVSVFNEPPKQDYITVEVHCKDNIRFYSINGKIIVSSEWNF